MSGSHRTSDGGYQMREPGEHYRVNGYAAASDSRGDRYRDSGYQRGYGSYRGTDGYRSSGGYRTPSGAYRTGGHRVGSGSHRASPEEPKRGWRTFLVLFGAVVGVAACALLVVVLLNQGHSTQVNAAGKTAAEGASPSGQEITVVPDSCGSVPTTVATALVPNFVQNPTTASATDQHSQCIWTYFAQDSGEGRQLAVDLRAILDNGDQPSAGAAHSTFTSEESSDSSGRSSLDTTQTIAAHEPLQGIGEEAYLTYSQDTSQGYGEAGINARVGNVLISVQYGGNENGKPLNQASATDGAKKAMASVLANLQAHS